MKHLYNILDRKFSAISDMSREKGTIDYQENVGVKSQNHVRNYLYLLQFSAEWCGLCKSIQPLVHVSWQRLGSRCSFMCNNGIKL